MIEDAIDKHFIKEWELFSRPNNQPKIKALTLFSLTLLPLIERRMAGCV